MKRVLTAIAILVSCLLLFAGCGEQQPSQPGLDVNAENAAIVRVIERFESGIETYDIDGIRECLTSSFSLKLVEGGSSIDKDLQFLMSELEKDEANQLYWRQHNDYVLDLLQSDLMKISLTPEKAEYVSSFKVIESAAGISSLLTDEGVIAWSFVKKGGLWKINKMVITFASPKALATDGIIGTPGLKAFFSR